MSAVGSLARPKSSKRRTSPNKWSKPSKKQKSSSRPTASTARPQRGGLPAFSRNEWQRGANLRSWDNSFAPSPASSAPRNSQRSEVNRKVARLKAQARDILLNPKAVGQMFWDELKHDAQTKKNNFLSKLRRR